MVGQELQPRLRLFQAPDVAEQANVVGDGAGGVVNRADRRQLGIDFAVLAAVPDFAAPVSVLPDGLPHRLVEFALVSARLHDAHVLAAHLRFGAASDRFKSGIDHEDVLVGVGDDNALVRAREDRRSKALVRLLLLALGDVDNRANHTDELSVGVEDRKAAQNHADPMAVLVARPRLELDRRPPAGQDLLCLLRHLVQRHRLGDAPPGGAGILDFVLGIAEDRLPARRVIGDVGRDPPIPQALVRGAHGQPETLLAPPQGLLGRLSGRDVLDHQHEVISFARFSASERREDSCVDDPAVFAYVPLLPVALIDRAGSELLDFFRDRRPLLRPAQAEQVHRHQFLGRIAEHLGQPPIDAQEFAVEADVGHADCGLLESHAEPPIGAQTDKLLVPPEEGRDEPARRDAEGRRPSRRPSDPVEARQGVGLVDPRDKLPIGARRLAAGGENSDAVRIDAAHGLSLAAHEDGGGNHGAGIGHAAGLDRILRAGEADENDDVAAVAHGQHACAPGVLERP